MLERKSKKPKVTFNPEIKDNNGELTRINDEFEADDAYIYSLKVDVGVKIYDDENNSVSPRSHYLYIFLY